MNEPFEITLLGTAVSTNFKRVVKAQKQIQSWTDELALAQASLAAAHAEFNDALNRWDTVSDNIAPKDLQEAPKAHA